MKHNYLVFAFCILLISCDKENELLNIEEDNKPNTLFDACPNAVDSSTVNYHQVSASKAGTKWWILSRQHGSCEGERGIFLFNELTSEIEVKIDLPNDLLSPHGLEYDKEGFLWVSGFDDLELAFQIDSNTGEVVRTWDKITGGGIAVRGDSIFIAKGGYIRIISKSDESLIDTFQLNSNTVQDITVIDDDIFYVVNGEVDPILKISMKTSEIDTIAMTGITALSTLAFKEDKFFAIDGNAIVSIDRTTKEKSVVASPNIEGWLTSIRPF